MWSKKRHALTVKILKPYFRHHLKKKYNLETHVIEDAPTNAVILSNHICSLDPFIVSLYFKENIYFMASVDLFERAFAGRIINYLVKPIPKEKSKKTDIAAVKNCLRVIKEGKSINICPEGNRTLSGKIGHIDYSIVKLVKMLKRPIILFTTRGGYGTDPRWGISVRKGKMEAGISRILYYDEYKDMDNDELYDIICKTLTVDDLHYYDNYKSKKKAEYIERVVHICPACHSMQTLKSKGDYVTCSSCGMKVRYNEDLTLSSDEPKFKFKYLYEWYDWQIECAKSFNLTTAPVYADDIYLAEPRYYKSRKVLAKGRLFMYKDRFVIESKKGQIIFLFKDISAVTLLGKKKMNFYHGEKTYQLYGSKRINLLKYMHLFYIIKNREEGNDDLSRDQFLGL